MISTRLESLARQFDVFLVDQFGVLHNGVAPFSGAIEALHELKSLGNTIVLISNSGKRASTNVERLRDLGFDDGSFDHFVSSGEVAWHKLSREMIGHQIPRQAKCFYLSRDEDTSAVDGLDLELVDDSALADVILLSGCPDDVTGIEHYDDLLQAAQERGVQCLCTNPDKLALTPDGMKFGPGAIADRYARLGGTVIWIGKPYPEIYDFALQILNKPKKNRVISIGDSVEHDIAGGSNSGFRTALVLAGILKDLSPAQLDDVYSEHNVIPDYVLSEFRFD